MELIAEETGGSRLQAHLEVDIAIGMIKEAAKIPCKCAVGRRIGELCGKHLMRVALELGETTS